MYLEFDVEFDVKIIRKVKSFMKKLATKMSETMSVQLFFINIKLCKKVPTIDKFIIKKSLP